jgi:hypothetical protein
VNYRPRYDDDFGQVDGEGAIEQFMPSNPGQPWLRGNLPPWHTWGKTEKVIVPFNGIAARSATQQLAKINYKRPESWHFFLGAKLIEAPTPLDGNHATLDAAFVVTIGVGRDAIVIDAFERFTFDWIGPNPPPLNILLWSTSVHAPLRNNGGPTSNIVDQLPAQDINVSAVCTNYFGPGPGTLEVTSFFAPKNHIRPEWFLPGPPEAQFPGSETEGR